jgi:hypothetical protein
MAGAPEGELLTIEQAAVGIPMVTEAADSSAMTISVASLAGSRGTGRKAIPFAIVPREAGDRG